ncbi:MAG: transporter, putative metabolite:H+ symporter [Mycobacterium sp.]|nr:transporter, putative metabolite:H+ symporter [Mycobacterium sp.]
MRIEAKMATPSPTERQELLTDIGRRLDRLPIGAMHRKVVVAIGLGLFFEVYEIFLSSTIATALKTQYGLGGSALQLLLASSFLGMFIGAAVFGRLADRIGRRRAFLLNLVWFSVWSVIAAFAPNPWFLVGARFMAGVGLGAEYPVADSYLSDVLPASHRGRMAAWAYTCSFLAVPVLGFLSLGLTERSLFGVAGWRILLLIGAFGAVLVVFLRRGLPESPRWLAGVGRAEDARAAVRAFASGADPWLEDASDHVSAMPVRTSAQLEHITNPLRRLRLSPYRERLVMLCVFHIFQPFGYYGFGTLAALVLLSRGYDVTSSLLFTALSYIGYPIGSLLSIPLLKRFERKYLVMAGVAAMAVCGLLFATVHSSALIVVFGFLTTAMSNVFSNVYHVYQAEIFPSDVRATAVGWTYSLSRLSSGALPFILIPVLDSYGAAAMFTVVVAALAATMAVIALMGPRTAGRNLEAINPI